MTHLRKAECLTIIQNIGARSIKFNNLAYKYFDFTIHKILTFFLPFIYSIARLVQNYRWHQVVIFSFLKICAMELPTFAL
jgi:glycopeptide antibiotics resistance protein